MFSIGDAVRLKVYRLMEKGQETAGTVRERITTDYAGGTRIEYKVRWVSQYGNISVGTHEYDELELAEGGPSTADPALMKSAL